MIHIHHCGYSSFVAALDNIITLLLRFFLTPLTITYGYILVSLASLTFEEWVQSLKIGSSMLVWKIEGNEQMCIKQSSSVISIKFGVFMLVLSK